MPIAYGNAIYKELGDNIAKELKDLKCQLIIDADTLTYTFHDCPPALVKKILALKQAKGESSILNEFNPEE